MKSYHRYLIILFLIALAAPILNGCRKKYIPEEFELISSRFGEFKMFDQILDGNAEGKYKTFPEIGNCNDIPDVQDNGEQVTFTFDSVMAFAPVTYRYENGNLELIENPKKTARIINK